MTCSAPLITLKNLNIFLLIKFISYNNSNLISASVRVCLCEWIIFLGGQRGDGTCIYVKSTQPYLRDSPGHSLLHGRKWESSLGERGEKAEGQVASNVGQNQMKLASQSLPRWFQDCMRQDMYYIYWTWAAVGGGKLIKSEVSTEIS